ncbi:GTP:AMP phosphotransferase, mitochondrial [Sphaceloma murrayae]|uniref:GTP:AMP phosphotransferase, mitochondrial n=1 Tax=Sphaceloma murrayae TaxID=2082308 RepID=A0A2K1QGY8_9PEZI|nr:GTP:AMP phosphotransferase, mitochondrial [Sphaceloma murrayae]
MASGLAYHNLNTNVNPLLSNPPARASIQVPKAAEPAPAAPAPAEAAPAPKKPTWQASAARPNMQPKKNGGQGHAAAAAAKAMAGYTRLQKQSSASSLTLSNFPMPGQAMASMVQQRSQDGLLTPENERMMGLGIHQSRSMAQLTCFSSNSRAGSARSVGSNGSGGKSAAGNSLGDGVGFTFKGTTNFVHPNRQGPRTHTPLSRSQNASRQSLTYEEEEDDVVVERMNSVTSDGGWKSGWSVNNGSVSGPSVGPDGEPLTEEPNAERDDLAPEDMTNTIIEEEHDDFDTGDRSPGRAASPVRLVTPPNDSSSTSSSKSGLSLRSRKSSLSIRLRAKEDPDTANTSAPTSPVRSSFDRALGMLARSGEQADPATRRASIAAARRAFEEKEAAKDRKMAEQEAKREYRRRTSEANERPLWRRRPSNAVDSAVDSNEEKSPTYQIARSNSMARTGSIARTGSVSRSNSISFSRPLFSPAEDDDDVDPLSRVPEQDSTPESAEFPAYAETMQPNHSMFTAAYQEEAVEEAGLFPPMRATPVDEQQQEGGGLFPPPPPPIQSGAIYNINGKMFDEYGMPIHQVALPGQRDGGEEFADARGRRLSKTKQAKGKFNKFSAWGKTRLLRV